MRFWILTAFFSIFILSCTVAKKASPSVIDFTILYNYLLRPDVSLSDDINYAFITNTDEFNKKFYMTKAAPGTAVVPDFALQSVVAIILKSTEKVISVDINKVEILGNHLNVSYTVTDTTSWQTYPHTPMAVAMFSTNSKVKQVSFYSNGIKQKTITANY